MAVLNGAGNLLKQVENIQMQLLTSLKCRLLILISAMLTTCDHSEAINTKQLTHLRGQTIWNELIEHMLLS